MPSSRPGVAPPRSQVRVSSPAWRQARDLALARAVHQQLLPPPLAELPALEVAARFLPSRRVRGDFFDYFQLDTRYLGLYLGDVPGKGLEAAMYALVVSGMMRGLPKSGHEPSRLVGWLNQRLCERGLPGQFCSLSYALLDLEQRHLLVANAGLPFPLLLRSDTLRRIEISGLPVGLFGSCEYNQAAVSLQPGDRLCFYTDGLTDSLEAFHPSRGDGSHQLQTLLAQHAGEPAPSLAAHLLRRLRTGRKARRLTDLPDDAAFLILRLL